MQAAGFSNDYSRRANDAPSRRPFVVIFATAATGPAARLIARCSTRARWLRLAGWHKDDRLMPLAGRID
ncbi:MAG: hypothetical protein D6744_02990 [Planctomycetota bacterium]|nr:MAG: hypothetical protein D6744_02990 [Planctomycetota bacterium]